MSKDWCKFFQGIEADPKAIVSSFTIRDMMLARQHLKDCDNCYVISERVLSSHDGDDNVTLMGLN